MPDPAATSSIGWPDVLLWALQHDGIQWTLIAVLAILFFKDFAKNVDSLSNAADRWAVRRAARRRELREPDMAQERLNADMQAVGRRLQLPHRGARGHEGEGG